MQFYITKSATIFSLSSNSSYIENNDFIIRFSWQLYFVHFIVIDIHFEFCAHFFASNITVNENQIALFKNKRLSVIIQFQSEEFIQINLGYIL